MKDKKDVTKKAIAIGAALTVVAGIGATINDGQDAQAKNISSRTMSNSKRTANSSKRPNSNAKESSPDISQNINESSSEDENKTTSKKSSGRRSSGRGSSSSSQRRKSQIKVLNSTTTEKETDSKRPTASRYKNVEDKKQQSKVQVQKSRGTSDTNKDGNKIIITVATK